MRDIADLLHRIETDEAALPAHLPQPVGLDGRADGAGLAAVLVDNYVGLHALIAEARFDEIDLRLHRGQVVLRPALQNEGPPERRQIGNLRDVKPDIFRQHIG